MKNNKTIQPWTAWSLVGLIVIMLHSFMPSPKAADCIGCADVAVEAGDPGNRSVWMGQTAGSGVGCSDYVNPDGTNYICKIDGDAYAGGCLITWLGPDDPGNGEIVYADVTGVGWGSVKVDVIEEYDAFTWYSVKITDTNMPGGAHFTTSVSGTTWESHDDGTHTPRTITLSAAGAVVFDPDRCRRKCGSCSSSSCSARPSLGSGTLAVSSVDFRLNLGQSSPTKTAGMLWLYAATPSTDLARPVSLQFLFQGPNVEVIRNAGTIAQINTPQGLLNVNVVSDYEYHLEFYYAADVGPKVNDLYTTTAPAFVTWVVQNPDGGAAYNRLWITEQRGGVNHQFQYTCSPVNSRWDMLEPDGHTTRSSWTEVPNPADTTITNYYRQTSVDGQMVGKNCKTYQYVPAIDEKLLLQEVNGDGATAQTDVYTYNAANLLERVIYANGNWAYYTYDGYKRKLKEYSAYNNSAPPASGEPDISTCHCKRIEYQYPDIDEMGHTSLDTPSSTTVKIAAYNGSSWVWQTVSMTDETIWMPNSGGTPGTLPASDETLLYFNPADTSKNLRTWTRTFTGGWGAGQPKDITHPDGSMTTYAYPDQYTTITTNADGTLTTRIVDDFGNPLSLSRRVDKGAGVVLERQTYTYTDELRRSYDVTDLAGRTTQYRYSDCCGLDTVTDPDGVVTEYSYDALRRQVASTVHYGDYGSGNGITTTNILDAMGRVLITKRIGTDLTTITQNQYQYDLLGRVIRQTNALGGVTTTDYAMVGNQLTVTTTQPDGGTRIETYYRDGRLQSVTGPAMHPVQYVYGVEQDTDGNWREYTQEIKPDALGGTTEWTKTYVDGAGRPYKTVYSAPTTPYPCSQSFYNDQGQLWKQVDPDGVTNLFVYNNNQADFNQGQRLYAITALSSAALGLPGYNNLVGQLNYLKANGVDRIVETTNTVVHATGGRPDLVRHDTYAWTNNETDVTGTLISRSETSTDGLQTWNTVYRDTSTGVADSTVTSLGSSRTVTRYAPDNSYTVGTYSYGRLVSTTNYDSLNNQLSALNYACDAHGRQQTVTDARNGATTYGYNNADLVTSVTTPNPGGVGGSPETTLTYYSTMLQATNMVQPDNSSVTNLFLLTGELGKQYGSRTYPVAYTYDYAGRLKTMTNWSDFSGGSGARVTTWKYDAYRGFLTNKVYDGNHAGPSYTYTPAGRLLTRTWARTAGGQPLVTTYGHDNAGGLTSVSYSDGTPGVTYTYDRLGRQSTLVRNGMTDTLTYNLANELWTESFSGGVLSGLSVTNNYDQYLRRTDLSIRKSPSSILASTAYGYDNASRLATVTALDSGLTPLGSATYAYLDNSPLVEQIQFKQNTTTRMTTTRAYDYLNRLTSISSVGGASSASPITFSYNYNAANQRTRNTLADGSYWIYQYDSLGQATSGCKFWADGTPVPGQQFNYTFDTIGNRTKTKSGGDQTGANLRTANYSANSLNQITSRDVPGTNDIIGLAFATNNVTVNGQTAWRRNEYFWATVGTNNTSSPAWLGVTVNSGNNAAFGNLFVPKTQEQFIYDADGNLTQDGRWTYAWDAENRLTNMTSLSTAPTWSKLRLDFAYDAKGRRIQKVVWAFDGMAYSPQYTNRFVYDGWNLIAILNPQSSIIESFTWGNDLSGSAQGAGGVGGLLEVSYYGTVTTNCFVAYDGNGNVAGLINAANGAALASYEYGPFGEVIRLTGPFAKANPFRFSTKYQDDESDLLYYGYRYYKPSAGTWPNRDPIEEVGFVISQRISLTQGVVVLGRKNGRKSASIYLRQGKQSQALYAFVDNDPIDSCDHLGLFPVDFKVYGNFCGPGWCDGKKQSEEQCAKCSRKKWSAAIDDMDDCCRNHDYYIGVGGDAAKADARMCECLKKIDPENITAPPGMTSQQVMAVWQAMYGTFCNIKPHEL